MRLIKFLLCTLVPLSDAFVSLTKHLSRGSHQSRSPSHFNESNADLLPRPPKHCESKWTYFNETNARYKCCKCCSERLKDLGDNAAMKRLKLKCSRQGRKDCNNFFWSTFNAAESLCKTVGGHLTSIHSFEENSFVAEMSKSGNRLTDSTQATWIGLVRSDYLNSNWNSSLTIKWVWTDGTKVDFLAWAPTKPNTKGSERCALLYSDPNANSAYALWYEKWIDFTCISNLRSFVCKKMALH